MIPMQDEPECKLSFIHFNDVYDIQPDSSEPKGGAAYFKGLLQQYRKVHTLTLFSGDVFSPALLSSECQGQNMIKPLNSFKIDCACLGNHDLDFPLEHVKVLKDQTNFTWLCSNVYNKLTGKRIADCEQYIVIQKNGLKIGIFSLAQKEWIDTLLPFYWQIVEYVPWQQFAQYAVKQLTSQKCDIIIALTHMMKHNDLKLAEKFKQIDLILGGHDHLVVHQKVNNSILIKSGTNFKNFHFIQVFPITLLPNLKIKQPTSYQQVYLFGNDKIAVRATLVQVNHEKTKVKPDPQIDEYVTKIYGQLQQKQQRICCYFSSDVDMRFQSIRKQQNGYLQLILLIYRYVLHSDCCLMNSGNFRSNLYIPAGPVPYRLLTNIIEDEVVVLKIPGNKLLQGLENSVSMYPNLSGRFATFVGIEFSWDYTKKPNQRILANTVKINGEPLKFNRIYTIAMHGFISKGGDGYTSFKGCEIDKQNYEKNNLTLINNWLNVNHEEWQGFAQKNPGKISIKLNENGQKMLVLHIQNPYNLKMIGKNLKENGQKIDQQKQNSDTNEPSSIKQQQSEILTEQYYLKVKELIDNIQNTLESTQLCNANMNQKDQKATTNCGDTVSKNQSNF